MVNRRQVSTTYAFLAIFVAIASVPQFLEDRELYLQELDTAFYSTPPFWLTYLVIEGCFTTVITTIVMIIIFFMATPNVPQVFGRIYPMMLLQFWLATAVAQAWSSWCKTLVQAYTALWAAGLIFWAFSGVQGPLNNITPALRWISDVNYWRWCLQYVVSVWLDQARKRFDHHSSLINPLLYLSFPFLSLPFPFPFPSLSFPFQRPGKCSRTSSSLAPRSLRLPLVSPSATVSPTA